MNPSHDETSSAGERAALPVPNAAGRPQRSLRAGGVWVLLAVLGLLLAGWQWSETRARLAGTQEELAARLAAQDRLLQESRGAAVQAAESGEAAKARLAVVEAKLAEFQTQYAALDAYYRELASGRDEGALSEAEQLIGLAAQQLQLAGNISGALLALTQADARLARIDRAQLAPVRRIIARDIERLRGLPDVDLVSLSVRIESVIEAADRLPLAYAMRPGAAPAATGDGGAGGETRSAAGEGSWHARLRGWWQELRGDFASLVRIQRLDRPEPALLAPTQEFFLRENVKLRLLNARLALLARDGVTFRAELVQARDWIRTHFDGREKAVAQAIATLDQVASLDIVVRLPRLDEALAGVRAIKIERGRGGK